MKNNFPKILIISETFKSNSGGGITLSNLFKDYPKELLANAIDAKEVWNINSNEICSNFYSLGANEKKVLKLFSFLQKKHFSGKYIFTYHNDRIVEKTKSNNIRGTIIDYFFHFLHFIGIYHLLYRYEISENFHNWVKDFNPDFIYTQLSNRELIKFTKNLVNTTGALLAIHIMDDWPTTISKNGLFKNYWHKKIDFELKDLLEKADILMSISEGMSIEYKNRYNKNFKTYHNPIELKHWIPFSKKDLSVNSNNIRILYAGRIGLGTSVSIIEIAKVIESLLKIGYNITFNIQTTTNNSPILNELKKYTCVKFNPVVDYYELPKIFSSADLLVMPIDFTKKGIQFLKYSMPTKASEYMISGTPILVYANKEVTLVDHAKKYNWAYCVTENSFEKLKSAIINLLSNVKLRETLSSCAYNHALNNFNSSLVRESFRMEFINNKSK